MVIGTGMKTAMSAWMFFKRVLMIAITVVRLLCGLAVFRRVRVVWVVVEVGYVGRDWARCGLQRTTDIENEGRYRFHHFRNPRTGLCVVKARFFSATRGSRPSFLRLFPVDVHDLIVSVVLENLCKIL